MANQELLAYIQKSLAQNATREQINGELVRIGWQEADIATAFTEVSASPAPQPPAPMPQVPTRVNPEPQSTPSVSSMMNAEISTPAPTFPVTAFSAATPPGISGTPKKIILIASVVIGVLTLGGGVAFAVKSGIFASAPYSEKNLISGVARAITKIDTSSYGLTVSVGVDKRDADAVPFAVKVKKDPVLIEKYKRDIVRANDISDILSTLNPYSFDGINKSYVPSLQYLPSPTFGEKASIVDPGTHVPYAYEGLDAGKDFKLSVTFETQEAVSQLKQSASFNTLKKTSFDGMTATFTKDSSDFLYLSEELPKPFLESLSEEFSMLPAELKASFSVAAQADWRKSDADWKFNTDATGDFGDLSFKVNVDALKKDANYYFKVNNMPSMLLSLFGGAKGQWIVVDSADATTTEGLNESFGLAAQLSSTEKDYKQHRQELTELTRKAIEIAEADGLFALKDSPKEEKVGERQLYRYDLKIRKEALAPYYKDLFAAVEKMDLKKDYPMVVDNGYAEYFASPEFNDLFDQYEKNVTITLWVDKEGFPAQLAYAVRVVPPDTAKQLADKQINTVFTLVLSDINKPIDIQKPEGAKTLEETMSGGPLGVARIKVRNATRISDIKNLQLAAELYYDSNQQYPAQLSDLVPTFIPVIPVDPTTKASPSYATLVSKGKRVAYHFGTSLEVDESASNSVLDKDADCNSLTGKGCDMKEVKGVWNKTEAFDGGDATGCRGEVGYSCYDFLTY